MTLQGHGCPSLEVSASHIQRDTMAGDGAGASSRGACGQNTVQGSFTPCPKDSHHPMPRQSCPSCPWSCERVPWTPLAARSGLGSVPWGSGVGLDGPCGSLPTQGILWFCVLGRGICSGDSPAMAREDRTGNSCCPHPLWCPQHSPVGHSRPPTWCFGPGVGTPSNSTLGSGARDPTPHLGLPFPPEQTDAQKDTSAPPAQAGAERPQIISVGLFGCKLGCHHPVIHTRWLRGGDMAAVEETVPKIPAQSCT